MNIELDEAAGVPQQHQPCESVAAPGCVGKCRAVNETEWSVTQEAMNEVRRRLHELPERRKEEEKVLQTAQRSGAPLAMQLQQCLKTI